MREGHDLARWPHTYRFVAHEKVPTGSTSPPHAHCAADSYQGGHREVRETLRAWPHRHARNQEPLRRPTHAHRIRLPERTAHRALHPLLRGEGQGRLGAHHLRGQLGRPVRRGLREPCRHLVGRPHGRAPRARPPRPRPRGEDRRPGLSRRSRVGQRDYRPPSRRPLRHPGPHRARDAPCARDERGRRPRRGVRAGREAVQGRRLRRRGAPWGARLPHQPVRLALLQQADGSLRRKSQEPRALSARDHRPRQGARRRRLPDHLPHLGGRDGPRRTDDRGHEGHRPPARSGGRGGTARLCRRVQVGCDRLCPIIGENRTVLRLCPADSRGRLDPRLYRGQNRLSRTSRIAPRGGQGGLRVDGSRLDRRPGAPQQGPRRAARRDSPLRRLLAGLSGKDRRTEARLLPREPDDGKGGRLRDSAGESAASRDGRGRGSCGNGSGHHRGAARARRHALGA